MRGKICVCAKKCVTLRAFCESIIKTIFSIPSHRRNRSRKQEGNKFQAKGEQISSQREANFKQEGNKFYRGGKEKSTISHTKPIIY